MLLSMKRIQNTERGSVLQGIRVDWWIGLITFQIVCFNIWSSNLEQANLNTEVDFEETWIVHRSVFHPSKCQHMYMQIFLLQIFHCMRKGFFSHYSAGFVYSLFLIWIFQCKDYSENLACAPYFFWAFPPSCGNTVEFQITEIIKSDVLKACSF